MRSRQVALRELRAIFRRSGPVSVDALPLDLYNDLLHHFGGIDAARREGGLDAPQMPRRWSLGSVVRELRRLHGIGLTITANDLRAAGRGDLLGAVNEYAGGLRRARTLAGIAAPPRRLVPHYDVWTATRVVSEIRRLHRANQSLAYSKVRSALTQAARRYCGSWAAAVEEAGLDYGKVRLVRGPYTKEEILAELRAIHAKKPEMLSSVLAVLPVGQAAARLFPSLEFAIRRAGIVDWPERLTRDVMTKREVQTALRLRSKMGRGLTLIEIRRDDPRLAGGVVRHYRGIYAAVADARVTPQSPTRWTKQEVLRQLRVRHGSGLPITAKAVNDASQMLYRAAIRFFGSYYAATRGLRVHKPYRSWTADKVLAQLQQIHTRIGSVQSKDLPGPLLKACKRYFGNLGNARRAARIQR